MSIEPWKLERLAVELQGHIHSCPHCQRNWECNKLGCGNPYCGLCGDWKYSDPEGRLAEAREDQEDEASLDE